jgi:membrane protein DedA with SNARE-associated domain
MTELLAMLDSYGLGLLFVVILLKEIGVPIPIPGDLLIVVAGARAATGTLPIWGVLLAAFAAGVIGAFVQYLLIRGPGRVLVYRFGRYVGLTPARLDKASGSIKGRGWVAVALGRAIPGLRGGVVAACGLTAVPATTFLGGLLAGTFLFVGCTTMLGYLVGPGAIAILGSLGIAVWPVILPLVLLGPAAWAVSRYIRRKSAQQDTAPMFDWANARRSVYLAAGRSMGDSARL